MGQKHSAKYSLTKKSANQRQSAQVGDEVAFSTDAPDRAPDEPVGVNISSQSNDYIGNAAQTMAKVWTERAVAESTEKDESKETGAEMKPEERGEADEQVSAPVPSNTGPEEADQQQRQAQAENESNQEEEGEDSTGTESEAQITLDEEKEAAEQISHNAYEAEAENVAQQEVGEVEAEVGQQDEEKQEQSKNAVADPVHAEAVSVPSEEEGPVNGVEPDECKENVPLENGTPMDPSSFYQISSIAVDTDESANGTVPGQCQQPNGEMVCCVGTGKPSEL